MIQDEKALTESNCCSLVRKTTIYWSVANSCCTQSDLCVSVGVSVAIQADQLSSRCVRILQQSNTIQRKLTAVANSLETPCPKMFLIFHHCTKFGAKMLIDTQIMAPKRNSRWRWSNQIANI